MYSSPSLHCSLALPTPNTVLHSINLRTYHPDGCVTPLVPKPLRFGRFIDAHGKRDGHCTLALEPVVL